MYILAHFFLDYEYEGMVNVWIHIITEDENQIYTYTTLWYFHGISDYRIFR
jgi:hypothetical protein